MTSATPARGLHWELTDRIHAVYYAVRRELGTAFPEHVYVNAMAVALHADGIRSARQVPYEVVFRGVSVGLFRADLVVDDLVLVEAKVAERIIPAHREQAWHYLAASRLKVAVILNFGPKPMTARVEVP